ncbi:hypothetical protein [Rhizobium sp. PL01]|uniref:hypothetical protein n=1 Tax=Rhizobium sp. PL01 TaxID=3085631 RepID=UPI002981967B|nr:hypothetical protein [Rhizobium sp. PL01]MDW5316982.1 hypothetical protein [Rhizobium sp. PL01]
MAHSFLPDASASPHSFLPKLCGSMPSMGLLVPAHVDPATGFRYYLMEQLPRARLIAKLRRIGLSVVRVAQMVEMSP